MMIDVAHEIYPRDYIEVVATVYGEDANGSLEEQKAVASTMINRLKDKKHFHYRNIYAVAKYAYDAVKERNVDYKAAIKYLQQHKTCNKKLTQLAHALLPVYYLGNVTTDATFYYEPKLQSKLHHKHPKKYKAVPDMEKDKALSKCLKTKHFIFFCYKK